MRETISTSGHMNTDLPLLSVFNNGIDSTITRWCTPSIHPSVPRVRGIYENDISISYHSLGNPSMDNGIFHDAHVLTAKAYGADHTLFGVNGSTGSNFMILRALKNQLGTMKLLAQRNVHKSIAPPSPVVMCLIA
jgi:lysine decarboxylase